MATEQPFYIVTYEGGEEMKRRFAWICRHRLHDRENPDWQAKICKTSYGIRFDSTSRKMAAAHLVMAHGGGVLYFSNETDPETKVWKKMKIEVKS